MLPLLVCSECSRGIAYLGWELRQCDEQGERFEEKKISDLLVMGAEMKEKLYPVFIYKARMRLRFD